VILGRAAFVHRRAFRLPHCDLFRLREAGSLMPGAARFSRAFSKSALSSERGERDRLVFGAGRWLTANPEPSRLFRCAAAGRQSCLLPAFSSVRGHGERPGPSDCEALGGGAGRLCAGSLLPPLQQRRGSFAGGSSRSGRRASRAGWAKSRPFGEAHPQPLDLGDFFHAGKAGWPSIQWWKGFAACRSSAASAWGRYLHLPVFRTPSLDGRA